MRLKLWKYIEAKVTNINVAPPMPRLSVTKADEPLPHNRRLEMRTFVDYRLSAGARVPVEGDPKSIEVGRQRVANILAREMFGDLIEELINLQERAFEKGWGDDADRRIKRLILLAQGEDVPEDQPND